jgi:hypothetical protein
MIYHNPDLHKAAHHIANMDPPAPKRVRWWLALVKFLSGIFIRHRKGGANEHL